MLRNGGWRIGWLVLAIAAWTPGCFVDEAPGSDATQDPDGTADVADIAEDEATATCGALPNCANVQMGCTPALAGQCFDCCDRTAAVGVPTQACCPGSDVVQDIPIDADDTPLEVGVDADAETGVDVPDDIEVWVGDVRDDDVGPDCGQTECIDCVCACDDGRMLPYGGCFDECQPPPEVIRNCSADCDAACGQQTPRSCQWPGGTGECPQGQECVQAPCPHCGMQPQSFCVMAPCEGTGCYTAEHCGVGQQCYGAYVPSGTMGFCSAPPAEAIGCWTDAECPSGTSCDGASHCPPCVACGMPDRPGACRLDAGQPEAVLLWVPGTLFSPGETIPVTWYDLVAHPIFLAGCSKYSVESKDPANGTWIDLGPPVVCGTEGVAVRVDAGEAYRDFAWVAPFEAVGSPFATFRLRGQFWTGCQADLPISSAKCTAGPFDVLSQEFSVGIAP